MEVFFDGPWSSIRGYQANCLGTGTHSSLDAFPRRLGGRDMGQTGIKGSKGGKGGTIGLMEELKQKKQRIEARIQRQAILVDEEDQKQAQAKLQPPPPLHRLAPITQDAGTAAESSVSKIK